MGTVCGIKAYRSVWKTLKVKGHQTPVRLEISLDVAVVAVVGEVGPHPEVPVGVEAAGREDQTVTAAHVRRRIAAVNYNQGKICVNQIGKIVRILVSPSHWKFAIDCSLDQSAFH